MTIASNKSYLDILQEKWDQNTIGMWSGAEQLKKESEYPNSDEVHSLDWFVEHADYLKSILQKKKKEALQAAVDLLFKELNGPGEKLLLEPIGRQHKYLLDKFAWAVLKAIGDYARVPGTKDDFDGRISGALQTFIKEYVI